MDLLALVLTGMAGPEMPACIAAASQPARAPVQRPIVALLSDVACVP